MSQNVVVCALYKFAVLNDYRDLRQPLLDLMLAKDVHGTLLLAREGINGTIAGSRAGIDAVKAWLGGIMGTQGQLAGHAQPAAPPPLSQDSAEYLDREAMSVRPSGREEKVTTTIVSDDDNMRVSESPQLMTGAV